MSRSSVLLSPQAQHQVGSQLKHIWLPERAPVACIHRTDLVSESEFRYTDLYQKFAKLAWSPRNNMFILPIATFVSLPPCIFCRMHHSESHLPHTHLSFHLRLQPSRASYCLLLLTCGCSLSALSASIALSSLTTKLSFL